MRIRFASSSAWVEAAATLAAALLMTVAGFEMLQGLPASPAQVSIAGPAAASAPGAPHFDRTGA